MISLNINYEFSPLVYWIVISSLMYAYISETKPLLYSLLPTVLSPNNLISLLFNVVYSTQSLQVKLQFDCIVLYSIH